MIEACIYAFLLSLGGLLIFRRAAPRLKLIDRPNQRSLHTRPTVVGAGLPVMMALLLATPLLSNVPLSYPRSIAAIVALLVFLGILDDRFRLPSMPRLVIYSACCLLGVMLEAQDSGWQALMFTLMLLWFINLFNFMDGADGFAGLQALLVTTGMGSLSWFVGAPHLAAVWWVILAVLVPFLCFNWPPASCFMGDAGSVPLGFVLGLFGIMSWQADATLGAAWLILTMPFWVDASLTLVLRLLAGHSPQVAHRDHAYQRLTGLTGSSLTLNVGLAVMHLVWLFPLAITAVRQPLFTPFLVILSSIPSLLLLAYLRRSA